MSSLVCDTSKPMMAVVDAEPEVTVNFRLDQATAGVFEASPFIEVSVGTAVAQSTDRGVSVRAYPPPADRSPDGWAAYLGSIATFESLDGDISALPILGLGSGRQTVVFFDGHYGLVRITAVGASTVRVVVAASTAAPSQGGAGALFV